MNSCVLMVEIIQDPQLRFTADNQTAIAEMLVTFPGLKAEEPPATLKVVGWGNLGQEIASSYKTGNRLIIEGRLGMNTIERPEGFKEKRAELTASRIHRLDADSLSSSSRVATPATAPPATSNVVSMTGRKQPVASGRMNQNPAKTEDYQSQIADISPVQSYESTPTASDAGDEDDITF